MSNLNTPRLPPLFISHGSPMTALEPREAGHFMQHLGQTLDAQFGRPRAVLAISAHTLARTPVLLAGATHHAVYDFGGFDPQLQQLRYDAPGAPALAREIVALAAQAGSPIQSVDHSGLDHGIWTPLRYIYPDADVPVLPLAFSPHQSPAALWTLGQMLAPLAQQGVLIMGTGSITHNLGLLFGQGGMPAIDAAEIPASAEFRQWLQQRIALADWPALLDYRRQAPHAVHMHPTDEHLLPLFVAAGAGAGAGAGADQPNSAGQRIHASLTFGALAMDAYAFGPHAAQLNAALHGQTHANRAL